MNTIPKQYIAQIITSTFPRTGIRFHGIADEDNSAKKMERRLSPTRRQPEQTKVVVEQRVSSDRRRPAFTAKA